MKQFLWALLISTLLLSCKEAPAPSKTDLLTAKRWKWVAGSISPAYDIFGIGVLVGDDYYTRLPECWRDDIWIFSAGNKFTHDEGASKCNVADPQSYIKGSWQFEMEENSIKITKEKGGIMVWDIKELTATSLKITETLKEDGQTYSINYSFGH